MPLVIVVAAGVVAWSVLLFRAARKNERWQRESGELGAREKRAPDALKLRSIRVMSAVYLAAGLLFALTYPFWREPDDSAHANPRYNGRGIATAVAFIALGCFGLVLGRRREKS